MNENEEASKNNEEADKSKSKNNEGVDEEIATSPSDISAATKSYIGPLEPGIFDTLATHNVEQVSTSFLPEGRIRFESVRIGGMTAEELEKALDEEKIRVSSHALSMLHNEKEFIEPVNKREKERQGETETLRLVRLRVEQLGFTRNPTMKALFNRAKDLGLERCPPETALYERMKDKDQASKRCYIAMEPVRDSAGRPGIFSLRQLEGGLWLDGSLAPSQGRLRLDNEVVFRLRTSDSYENARKNEQLEKNEPIENIEGRQQKIGTQLRDALKQGVLRDCQEADRITGAYTSYAEFSNNAPLENQNRLGDLAYGLGLTKSNYDLNGAWEAFRDRTSERWQHLRKDFEIEDK